MNATTIETGERSFHLERVFAYKGSEYKYFSPVLNTWVFLDIEEHNLRVCLTFKINNSVSLFFLKCLSE